MSVMSLSSIQVKLFTNTCGVVAVSSLLSRRDPQPHTQPRRHSDSHTYTTTQPHSHSHTSTATATQPQPHTHVARQPATYLVHLSKLIQANFLPENVLVEKVGPRQIYELHVVHSFGKQAANKPEVGVRFASHASAWVDGVDPVVAVNALEQYVPALQAASHHRATQTPPAATARGHALRLEHLSGHLQVPVFGQATGVDSLLAGVVDAELTLQVAA